MGDTDFLHCWAYNLWTWAETIDAEKFLERWQLWITSHSFFLRITSFIQALEKMKRR
jgi:hypothetical protein